MKRLELCAVTRREGRREWEDEVRYLQKPACPAGTPLYIYRTEGGVGLVITNTTDEKWIDGCVSHALPFELLHEGPSDEAWKLFLAYAGMLP